jgi:hypothetical protein
MAQSTQNAQPFAMSIGPWSVVRADIISRYVSSHIDEARDSLMCLLCSAFPVALIAGASPAAHHSPALNPADLARPHTHTAVVVLV